MLDPTKQHLLDEYILVKRVTYFSEWTIENLVGDKCWVMDGKNYDDVARAPAVVEKLAAIANLIDPKILKLLVDQQFHHEINSTYFDLMNQKNHWEHPENWDHSDSE